jgi:hypothetical protein
VGSQELASIVKGMVISLADEKVDSGITACESVGGEGMMDGVYKDPRSELNRTKSPVVESLSKPQVAEQSFPIRKPLMATSTSFIVGGASVATARLTDPSNSEDMALWQPWACAKWRKS